MVGVFEQVTIAPRKTIVGYEDINRLTLKCVAEETVRLNAVIHRHGEDGIKVANNSLVCFTTDTDTLPSPQNITLDSETEILSWSHVFHPDLPVDFNIIHECNISYLVTVLHRESGEREEKMMSHETSLNISHVLDHCRRQEFTVQTLVNDIFYSQSSSYLTNPSGEELLYLVECT